MVRQKKRKMLQKDHLVSRVGAKGEEKSVPEVAQVNGKLKEGIERG